ncbi:YciI family protein [Streptomyces sp. NBC_01465]|uniref:YciI family protein n=1 Tax=Streptomyces sp. NBC_01465 TaxID=2903878 RepID=UPI002E37165E|nr:hypothetical protein [Streptomyces sp. NBC_01465]
MRYMVQTFVTGDSWETELSGFSRGDIETMIEYCHELNDELVGAGELVETRGLGGPGTITTVQSQPSGEPVVFDGPSAPGDKSLIAYWVVDVATHERAVEIASRISATPGPGGKPSNQVVELHLVPSGPPEA